MDAARVFLVGGPQLQVGQPGHLPDNAGRSGAVRRAAAASRKMNQVPRFCRCEAAAGRTISGSISSSDLSANVARSTASANRSVAMCPTPAIVVTAGDGKSAVGTNLPKGAQIASTTASASGRLRITHRQVGRSLRTDPVRRERDLGWETRRPLSETTPRSAALQPARALQLANRVRRERSPGEPTRLG